MAQGHQHLGLFLLVEVEVLALGVLVLEMADQAEEVVGRGLPIPQRLELVIHLHNRLPEGMAHQQFHIKDSMGVLVIPVVRRMVVQAVVVVQAAQEVLALHPHQEKQGMVDLHKPQQLQVLQ